MSRVSIATKRIVFVQVVTISRSAQWQRVSEKLVHNPTQSCRLCLLLLSAVHIVEYKRAQYRIAVVASRQE